MCDATDVRDNRSGPMDGPTDRRTTHVDDRSIAGDGPRPARAAPTGRTDRTEAARSVHSVPVSAYDGRDNSLSLSNSLSFYLFISLSLTHTHTPTLVLSQNRPFISLSVFLPLACYLIFLSTLFVSLCVLLAEIHLT